MILEKNAKITTAIPGPKSKELLEKRLKYVARGVSYSTEVFVDEAKGALIKDIDGNVFVDFAAGIGVQNVGHCDEEIVETIKSQVEKNIHTSFNVAMYEPYINLAEKLVAATPGDYDKKALLINSGTEAVENAVKIARKYTGKPMILSLENAFHGRTYMSMTLTSKVKPYKYGFAPYNSDTHKIPSPYCYRCQFGKKHPGCNLECAQKLEDLLKGELSADMIAALVVEPVQGEGGFIVPPKGYLQRLQKICNDNNILFIVDEIQAGFARTGTLFASEQFDIEPDMMTMSKSLAAGMPLAAVVGKEEIMENPIVGSIGGTFSGNPVACAAAIKVLEKIEKEKLTERANAIGEKIKSRLSEMQKKYPVIGDIRGLGAMCAVEFITDPESKEPNKEIIGKITKESLQEGVIFISAGIYGNVLRFLPPLVMTDEQLEYGLDVLEKSLEKALS
ncbi:4-aminobutyrate--2-oxoglutarate transaminase [Ilyobacter polytropus]|jgi:4-aminobutyrate aminotransferase/(S)-3-amino-2-methylpropionate transaminase|uniref:4-aminobutyrate aminotransferase apoenzyme n=1 Tax=Ilyobacter polytropus (strain ATCC 51220 / DSM 2926 / LMG 16218 / CuHBu1) TaxID=572544 RepID=E3HC96_ILYPC|nr:4-aminobutyrate--2-oxoglutarate transaminase [Ilyobacter polytropus]ADO84356.1 4-aminobutyrate aminotransferase apoenzyme [Ilyobacter polytropus DSM 2926]